MIRINRIARTFSGLIVPWNVVGMIGMRQTSFVPGSLTWPDELHLLIRHDHSQIVGIAESIDELDDGLWGRFRAVYGEAGTRGLAIASRDWSFSVGVENVAHEERGPVRVCVSGDLVEVSLTPNPAFPQRSSVASKKQEPEEQEPDQENPDQVELEPESEQKSDRLPPPEFISEANRLQIQYTGEALEDFTGRILTREDLDAYNKAQQEKF